MTSRSNRSSLVHLGVVVVVEAISAPATQHPVAAIEVHAVAAARFNGLRMDDVIDQYDRAWNASDLNERRRLLEAALTEDCELVEPRGCFRGRAAIGERITGFSERFPGARVDVTTKVDEHNGFARYGWTIVDGEGKAMLEGIDVVERAADGRLRKVVMFFGALEFS